MRLISFLCKIDATDILGCLVNRFMITGLDIIELSIRFLLDRFGKKNIFK